MSKPKILSFNLFIRLFFYCQLFSCIYDGVALAQDPWPHSLSPADNHNSLYGKPAVSQTNISTNITPTPNDALSSPKLGILEIEEHLAKNKYDEKPNLDNRGILIKTYERIALALCFPTLNYLIEDHGIEPTAGCNQILEKISKIHVNNTILICAQKGVNSLDCARSFEMQSVRKYKPEEYLRTNLTSSTRKPLDIPEVKNRFEVVQKKLIETIEAYQGDSSVPKLKALDSSLFSALSIICGDEGLMLTLKKETPEVIDQRPEAEDIRSITKEIESLGKSKERVSAQVSPTAVVPSDNNFYRTRLLSDQCYDTIVDALNIDNRLSSAICFRDGFIANSCLSALRRIRSLKETQDPATTAAPISPKNGLASF